MNFFLNQQKHIQQNLHRLYVKKQCLFHQKKFREIDFSEENHYFSQVENENESRNVLIKKLFQFHHFNLRRFLLGKVNQTYMVNKKYKKE